MNKSPASPARRRPRTPEERGTLWAAFVGVGATVLLCAFELLGCGGALASLAMLGLFATIAVAFVGGVVALFFRKTRPLATSTLVACTFSVPTVLIASYLSGHARSIAFGRLAVRSEPLVAAIRAYEQRHGEPPASLHALVPEFLEALPETGMPSYPAYSYEVQSSAEDAPRAWRLKVECSSGLINFDEFVDWPESDGSGYDAGQLTRHGEWVYAHE
jgi:hypothetical protein